MTDHYDPEEELAFAASDDELLRRAGTPGLTWMGALRQRHFRVTEMRAAEAEQRHRADANETVIKSLDAHVAALTGLLQQTVNLGRTIEYSLGIEPQDDQIPPPPPDDDEGPQLRMKGR